MSGGRPARIVLALALAVVAAGCGKRGTPRPPEPRGPLDPRDLRIRQVGDDLVVSFRVPGVRGDGPGQVLVRADVLRVSFPEGAEPTEGADTFRRRAAEVARLTPAAQDGPTAGWQEGDRLVFRESRFAADGDLTGGTVRYGVRLRDRRGRPSTLVATADVVPVVPPPPPERFEARNVSAGVALSWDDAGEEASYRVYRAPADDPGLETEVSGGARTGGEFVDSTVRLGARYRYVVRRVAAPGTPPRESASSAPVEIVAVDRFAPAPPEGLVAVQEGTSVRLFWDPSEERDVAGYRVRRAVGDGPWETITSEPVIEPLHLDPDVRVDQRIRYRVTAVDRADPPNESEPSAEAVVVVAPDPGSGGG